MYHKYFALFILAGCFSGHILGKQGSDTGKKNELVFESLGEGFLVGENFKKINSINYAQIRVKQEGSTENEKGLSGYYALENAFLTKSLLDAKREHQQKIAQKFTRLTKTICDLQWLQEIIEARRKNLAVLYLKDKITLGLLHATKSSGTNEDLLFDFSKIHLPLSLEKDRVAIDKAKFNETQQHDIRTIGMLSKSVAQEIVDSCLAKASPTIRFPEDDPTPIMIIDHQEDTYHITHDMIIEAFVTVCDKKLSQKLPGDLEGRIREALAESSLKTKESFSQYFAPFADEQFTVKVTGNRQELTSQATNGVTISHKKMYGPELETKGHYGHWLLPNEMIDIAQKEKFDTSRLYHEQFKIDMDIHTLDCSDDIGEVERMTTEMRYETALEKAKKAVKPVVTVFLILQNHHWFTCVIAKLGSEFWFIVTDSLNIDRSTDPLITKFIDKMGEKPAKKPIAIKDFLEKGSSQDKNNTKEEVVNYEAPLADIPLEELPSLPQLFGGDIPNDIKIILNYLKNPVVARDKMPKLKNSLILHGPPGTGKSTIAQVMGRSNGWEILYAGGGDFRTAYQGSSKAKLDDLFRKADDIVKNGKKCLILIDEIDGTSSKVQPHGSTQEDNRANKALQTTLDQYKNKPNIYVIATTNYFEKMEPAIRRRFEEREVPLPTYKGRKSILEYHLKKNSLEIKNGDANSLTPAFFEMLLTATEGFSGDDLSDIINNSALQAFSGLTPDATVGTRFRCNIIDYSNHSLLSSVVDTLAFPYYHIFHWLGAHSQSQMDNFVYSQFLKRKKLKADLADKEYQDGRKTPAVSELLHPSHLSYIVVTSLITAGSHGIINSGKHIPAVISTVIEHAKNMIAHLRS